MPEWERIAEDPRLLEDARRRYSGSGDLADQLWWLGHPGEPTAAGLADPVLEADRRRRELYRRGGDPASAERVRQAERSALSDRAAAEAALRDVLAEEERGSAATAGPIRSSAAPVRPPERAAPARGRRTVVVVVGVVALAIGAALGALVVRQQASAPARVPALTVFDRPASGLDEPVGSPLGSLTQGATTRRIGTYSSIGLEAFGVRRPDGRLCLLVLVLGSSGTATCTTRAAFAESGLEWVGIAEADPVDDSGSRPSSQVRFTWRPDGRVRVDPVASPRPGRG